MPVFESTEKMYAILGKLFETLLADAEMGTKFRESKISIKFNISDPSGTMWLTEDGEVLCGSADIKPTIEMTLGGDTCHLFWLKQISLPIALAKGKIKAKGPMPKVLKLLPMLKPAYAAYPEIASSNGLPV